MNILEFVLYAALAVAGIVGVSTDTTQNANTNVVKPIDPPPGGCCH